MTSQCGESLIHYIIPVILSDPERSEGESKDLHFQRFPGQLLAFNSVTNFRLTTLAVECPIFCAVG
jgi:hypothetical protein